MKEVREQPRQYGRGRIVGAFVLGATAGSVLALLFAPASGRVTRKRIGMKLRSFQRETSRRLGHAQRLLARKAETLRDAAGEGISHAREWVAGHVAANGHERRSTRRRALRHA